VPALNYFAGRAISLDAANPVCAVLHKISTSNSDKHARCKIIGMNYFYLVDMIFYGVLMLVNIRAKLARQIFRWVENNRHGRLRSDRQSRSASCRNGGG